MASLQRRLALPEELSLGLEHHHALDARVCVLAGQDFLLGQAFSPLNCALAKREGWMWVRRPGVGDDR